MPRASVFLANCRIFCVASMLSFYRTFNADFLNHIAVALFPYRQINPEIMLTLSSALQQRDC